MKINLFAIRHGEATHNVLFKEVGMSTFFDENYYDTELTDKGFNQAQELGNKWSEKNKMDFVIVSPLFTSVVKDIAPATASFDTSST